MLTFALCFRSSVIFRGIFVVFRSILLVVPPKIFSGVLQKDLGRCTPSLRGVGLPKPLDKFCVCLYHARAQICLDNIETVDAPGLVKA
jgi:hypothetical protein